MTKQFVRLSMTLSLSAILMCMNSAHAQKDSTAQNWGGQPSLTQQPTTDSATQPRINGVRQPGPAGARAGWGAQPGTSNWIQRPGPAGAMPGWGAQPGMTSGQRPGTTWSQQPASGGSQNQSQNWAEQQARNAEMTRQALQAQANQAPRPQVAQYERWKQEWAQQHPGEPLPNMGVLEKMHRDEITTNIRQDGAAMWARRRQEVQARYQMAKQMQQSKNAAQHVTWTQQQWTQWDKQYDQEQRQAAQDYINAAAQSGADARAEAANTEYRKSLGLDH
jgi:hypothetical protein